MSEALPYLIAYGILLLVMTIAAAIGDRIEASHDE